MSKKIKRIFGIILSASILANVLCACSNSTEGSSAPQESSVSSQASSENSADSSENASSDLTVYGIDVIKEMNASEYFSDFETANNCKITYIAIPNDKYVQSFMVAVNGGQNIDVVSLNGQNVRSFASKDLIMDLTDLVDWWDRFYENSLVPLTFNDRKYGVPMGSGQCSGLYYNKEILDQYGLQPPETIQDVLDIAQKLKGEGISAITNGGATIYMWPIWFFEALNQTSGNQAIERTTQLLQNEAKWTDADFVEAMQALQTLGTGDNVFQQGFNGQDEAAGIANFAAGKSAMWFGLSGKHYSFLDAGMEIENLGVTHFPLIKDTYQAEATGGPFGAAVGLYSKISEENKETALKLVDYMSQDDFAIKYTTINSRPPLFANKTAKVEVEDPIVQTLQEEISPTTVVYLDWYYPPEITTALQQQIQAVTGGQVTAEEAMEEMQRVTDELFASGYDFNAAS